MKLQEEIEASQGLQGIFDCRIETKIMFPPLPPPPPPPPRDCTELSSPTTTTTTTTFIFLKIKPKLTEMKVNKSRAFETSMRYFNTILKQKVWRRVKFFFRHAQKMRKICNVLRLINAKRTFARTYKGTKDRACKEIQDEIVLLLGQVKCFHLSETESMKEHFISFSDFSYFFKQESTAMHYLTLFQEL